MANPEHLKILKRGVEEWNEWRRNDHYVFPPSLNGADLRGVDLRGADLSSTSFFNAILSGADLRGAILRDANLASAKLIDAKLNEANLSRANLFLANLSGANLSGADLFEAYINSANLNGVNLRDANLVCASFIATDIGDAILSRCRVYGISIWDLQGKSKEQKDLVITKFGQPEVTVDEIEVAQFIYLLLENQKIRNVIDSLTAKSVLILGRFSAGRKKVLDAIKDSLRAKGYLPILFDFEKPVSRDLLETIKTLASISRFVIADITDARSVLQELAFIVPNFPSIPVKLLIQEAEKEYGMFDHIRRYNSVLDTYEYPTEEDLIANFDTEVVSPLEQKVIELKAK